MAYTVQVGSVRCHILSDGLNIADGGGFFGVVPRVMWQRVIEGNELNQIPNDIRCMLIESDAGLILVDTGNGDKLTDKQRQILGVGDQSERLLQDMAQVGFRAEDVDVVLLTHLHGDHAGGATRWAYKEGAAHAGSSAQDAGGETAPVFSRARYIVQRLDLADASYPNERTAATYHAANWEPVKAAGQLEIVDGPQRLGSQVRTEIAPGHTPALQVVWVEDGGEHLLFLGDACSWAVHMDRLAWVPSFDIWPMVSIETKRSLRTQALERDALLVFQHDPQVVTGRLRMGKRGPAVDPALTRAAWADPLAAEGEASRTPGAP